MPLICLRKLELYLLRVDFAIIDFVFYYCKILVITKNSFPKTDTITMLAKNCLLYACENVFIFYFTVVIFVVGVVVGFAVMLL